MLFYVQRPFNSADVNKSVQNVLSAFLNLNHDKVGFSTEILHIAVFLLIFCAEHNAYKILC